MTKSHPQVKSKGDQEKENYSSLGHRRVGRDTEWGGDDKNEELVYEILKNIKN